MKNPRKNARKTALPTSTNDYRIRHDGGVWGIRAKDFPAQRIFRVYRIEGDINRIPALIDGIRTMLTDAGIDGRRIELRI
jgi:hypothetical protein